MVVIGGGITGAGVALDAASRGYSVALVEREDFAVGTSSRSSKLVHGGLRYLQNFDLGLVREALLERAADGEPRAAPGAPAAAAGPAFDGKRPDRLIGVGLNMYDVMATRAARGRRGRERDQDDWSPDRHRVIERRRGSRAAARARRARRRAALPLLRLPDRRRAARAHRARRGRALRRGDREPLRGGPAWSRRTGAPRGVRCATRWAAAEFEHPRRQRGQRDRRVGRPHPARRAARRGGGAAHPAEPRHAHHARPRPAADRRRRDRAGGQGRSIFALPWLGRTLIGTTDNDYEGALDHVPPAAADVDYLLDACNSFFGDSLAPARPDRRLRGRAPADLDGRPEEVGRHLAQGRAVRDELGHGHDHRRQAHDLAADGEAGRRPDRRARGPRGALPHRRDPARACRWSPTSCRTVDGVDDEIACAPRRRATATRRADVLAVAGEQPGLARRDRARACPTWWPRRRSRCATSRPRVVADVLLRRTRLGLLDARALVDADSAAPPSGRRGDGGGARLGRARRSTPSSRPGARWRAPRAWCPAGAGAERRVRLRLRGRVLELRPGAPLVMGIVNATPDSFSDRPAVAALGRAGGAGAGARERGRRHRRRGRRVRPRPTAPPVSAEEEVERVVPLVERLAAEGVAGLGRHLEGPVARAVLGRRRGDDQRRERPARSRRGRRVRASPARRLSSSTRARRPKEKVFPAYDDVVADVLELPARADGGRAAARRGGGAARASTPGPTSRSRRPSRSRCCAGCGELDALGRPLLLAVVAQGLRGRAHAAARRRERLAGTLAAVGEGVDAGAAIVRVHDVAATRDFLAVRAALRGESRRAARAAPRPAPPPRGRQPRLNAVPHGMSYIPTDEEDFHMAVLDRKELEQSPLADLHAIASELGIEGYRELRREDLIDALGGGPGGGRRLAGRSRAEERPPRSPRPRRRGRRAEREPSRGAQPSGRRAGRRADRDERDDPEEPEEDATRPRAGVLDILPNGSGFMRPERVRPLARRRLRLARSDPPLRAARGRRDRGPGPLAAPQRAPSVARARRQGQRRRRRAAGGAPALRGPHAGLRVAGAHRPGRARRRAVRPRLARRGRRAARLRHHHAAAPDRARARRARGPGRGRGRSRACGPRRSPSGSATRRSRSPAAGSTARSTSRLRPPRWRSSAASAPPRRGRHAVVVIDSLDALPPPSARRVFGAARATEEGGTLTVIASTGLAGEPMRLATTRIVLERRASTTLHGPALVPASSGVAPRQRPA